MQAHPMTPNVLRFRFAATIETCRSRAKSRAVGVYSSVRLGGVVVLGAGDGAGAGRGGPGLGAGFGAAAAGVDFTAESGNVFRCRLILPISSGAIWNVPFLNVARILLRSIMARISASGIPNSAEASRNVFVGNGIPLSPEENEYELCR